MFDADLILAILHHALAFGLLGVLASEFALVRTGMGPAQVRQLAPIDTAYGILAVALIGIGVLRVLFGAKGWDYYSANWAFWAKMAAFLAVGLLSAGPTVEILRWRKASKADAGFTPPATRIARVRGFLVAQLVAFVLIPTFAALMARGYGS